MALLEQLNFCDYYLSELRKVDANIVDELANLDSADMIEAAAKKASEIVRRPLNYSFFAAAEQP